MKCHKEQLKFNWETFISNLSSFPDTVVTAKSLDLFQTRADKFRNTQDFVYDFEAQE